MHIIDFLLLIELKNSPIIRHEKWLIRSKIKKYYDLVLEKDIFFVETRTGSSFHLRLPPFCFFTFRLNRRCTAERCFVVQLQVVGTEVNEYKNIVGVCICREIFNTY